MSELGILIEEAETTYEWSIEEAIEEAKRSGMYDVIYSDPDRLLLDLDDDSAYTIYKAQMGSMSSLFELKQLDMWLSKSGIGRHVVLSCKPLTFPERIAVQACLGSDRRREILGLAMFRDGKENPSVLFRPKKKI